MLLSLLGAIALLCFLVAFVATAFFLDEWCEARLTELAQKQRDAQQADIDRLNADIKSGEWDRSMKKLMDKALVKTGVAKRV